MKQTENTLLVNSTETESYGWRKWRKNQLIPACVLLLSCAIGIMSVRMIGPSLLDLQLRTSSTIQQISWVASARALGAMIGSIILGYVIEHWSRWLQVSFMILMSGIVFAGIPWITNFWVELVIFVMYGFTTGYAFPGAQLTVYSLWDNVQDSVSWQNAFQLANMIGSFFAPLVIQPFLLEVQNSNVNITTHVRSYGPDDVTVMYGFTIVGSLLTGAGILCFLVYILLDTIKITHHKKGIPAKQENPSVYLKNIRIAFVILLILYYIFQSVIHRVYSNNIVVFAVYHLGWSKAEGSNVAAAYYAAGIVAKLLMIFTVRVISLELQVFGGLVLTNLASIALVFFVDKSKFIMWVFSILVSTGSCITVSVLIAWTDKHIGIKGHIGVLYSLAGSIGDMVFSALIGYLFENVSYFSLIYMLVLASVTCLIIMIVLQMLGTKYKRESEKALYYKHDSIVTK